ncbi:hypothetical protein ACFSR7_09320 [Cohnella sp. GCM10020058]|uniref:hypothetical protein n=1 Tax=Cohnella sp. GCM10020058 TaxID=3317330 RepID=UPI00363A278B
MDRAINPKDRLVYKIDEWLKLFSADHSGLCIVCGNKLEVRAESTVSTTTHFWHSVRGSNCPTIQANSTPYLNLLPSAEDEANALKVKSDFTQRFYEVFLKCDLLCAGLKFEEFKELVELANTKRIWYYRDLILDFLPYIFLTLKKFSSRDSRFRDNSFYFVFEPNLKRYNELWIDKKIRKKIWKVESVTYSEKVNGVYKDKRKQVVTEYDIDSKYPSEPVWVTRSRTTIQKLINLN